VPFQVIGGLRVAEKIDEATDIKETDIVFDCPHCGKSLAIDYRGAGLTIPCTDCGNHVEVPIPEGMDIADIDSSDEEQEIRILNLRRSLAATESHLSDLKEELESTNDRREALEGIRKEKLERERLVKENLATVQRSLESLSSAVQAIADAMNLDPS
jgi:transcription elongation factor Elf1